MNSVHRAIMVTATGLPASAMLTYRVELYAYTTDSYVSIYRGRCMSDSTGSATMRLDGVLRDYAYRQRLEWLQVQQVYVPAELAGIDSTLRVVEDGTAFMASEVVVTVFHNGITVWQSEPQPVWAGFLAPWQVGELPYYDGLHINLATIGNDAVPHLPPVSTGRMWLGLSLMWLDGIGRNPEIGVDLSKAEMLLSGAGCYAVAYTLQDLYNVVSGEATVDGGYADSVADETVDGGDADDVADDTIDGGGAAVTTYDIGGTKINMYYEKTAHVVAEVDTCASPYYVAWLMPNGGWMSRGFDGNTTVGGMPQAQVITDIMDSDRVVSIDEQQQYTLNSGFVTRDDYNLLCTLRYAREVYLYDTANDKGVWCTVDNRMMQTAGNVRWHNEPFTLTLKAMMHTEI